MTQYPHNISMNFYYTWNFQIVLGYNNLIISQPVSVSKGYFILITQGTGKIAIDISGNATYSDMVWNTTQQWTKLAEFSNRRFYLTPLFNFTSYQNTFNIKHSYTNIGVYTLSFSFKKSNITIQQIINITDCKYFLIKKII
jgi:hypothetical protein